MKHDIRLGQGAFGTVYKGKNKRTGKSVAVKQLNEGATRDWRGNGESRRETDTLKKIIHENVVRFEGTVENLNAIYIIT